MPDISAPTDNEIAQSMINAFEKQKQELLAETHKIVSALDDKIRQLSALEYHPD
jgi:hypothetical protein